MKPTEVTVEELFRDAQDNLGLVLRAGEQGLERGIQVPRIQKPGLALTGYREQLHQGRVLSLGKTEVDYLATVGAEQRRDAVDTVLEANPACIVVTRNLAPPRELLDACEREDLPLFVSNLPSAEFFHRAVRFLQERLSPARTIRGVLVDVLGVGVLLVGESGVGKTEAALELVARGHRLVADDAVLLRRAGKGLIDGFAPPVIRHHMRVPGMGVINVKDLFGIAAVREVKRLELIVELTVSGEDDEPGTQEILGEALPLVRLRTGSGRSVSTLIEVAARDRLLKIMGHDSARELSARLDRRLAEEAMRLDDETESSFEEEA